MPNIVTTEVVNNTDGEYLLKEGNAGVFQLLSRLSSGGGSFQIVCDPNATYREYWVGTDLAGVQTIISSDDCVECSIIIFSNDSKGVRTEMVKRDHVSTVVRNNSDVDYVLTTCNAGGNDAIKHKLSKHGGDHSIFIDPKDANSRKHKLQRDGGSEWADITKDCIKNEKITINIGGLSELEKYQEKSASLPESDSS